MLKTKILIGLIILIGLGVGGFFVYKNISVPEIEKGVVPAPSIEVEIYKGVWMPILEFQDVDQLPFTMQKLKDIGANTVFFQVSAPFPDSWFEKAEESLPPVFVKRVRETLPIEKETIINIIQAAHNSGLKVGLTVSDMGPVSVEEIDYNALSSKIIEYAELAEEYDVELFAPMNEPEKVFKQNVREWMQEILPKIKAVYHGDIVWKGVGVGVPSDYSEEYLRDLAKSSPGDYAGYDYIGNGIMLPGKQYTLEEYSQYVDKAIKYMLAQAERDGCKGVMVGEFGVLDAYLLSEGEVARAHEIVLEKAKDKDRVYGVFALDFFGVEFIELPEHLLKKNIRTEEVIKKWFKEIL